MNNTMSGAIPHLRKQKLCIYIYNSFKTIQLPRYISNIYNTKNYNLLIIDDYSEPEVPNVSRPCKKTVIRTNVMLMQDEFAM